MAYRDWSPHWVEYSNGFALLSVIFHSRELWVSIKLTPPLWCYNGMTTPMRICKMGEE